MIKLKKLWTFAITVLRMMPEGSPVFNINLSKTFRENYNKMKPAKREASPTASGNRLLKQLIAPKEEILILSESKGRVSVLLKNPCTIRCRTISGSINPNEATRNLTMETKI